MAHQYSRVGFKSSVEVNEVNLSLSYGGVMTTAIVGIKVHKPGHVIIIVCKQSLHVKMQYCSICSVHFIIFDVSIKRSMIITATI